MRNGRIEPCEKSERRRGQDIPFATKGKLVSGLTIQDAIARRQERRERRERQL